MVEKADVNANAHTTTLPVTVLTGFLGAGKTTLLNHIITADHGKRYAVIVNEFGELGVDNDLIVDADEEIFEMNNGCVCCTVRGDLIRILGKLLRRRGRFDGIIIETTGLADPAPVAQTFFVDEFIRARTRLDAVVTVVDARNIMQSLKANHESVEQIAFADVIILNKTDLVQDPDITAVEAEISKINRFARVHRAEYGGVALEHVLGQGGFDLQRALDIAPYFLDTEEHQHSRHVHHDHHVGSVSLVADRAVDQQKFMRWISGLLQDKGADILRTKGIINFSGETERFAFQAVRMMADGDFIGPWKAGDSRQSRLVFIGRDLSADMLEEGFHACLEGSDA